MLTLKDYQNRCLATLGTYLKRCSDSGKADVAFYETTSEVFGQGIPYKKESGLSDSSIPYVCIRVPTGGGKTLIACHSISIINDNLLRAPHSVVLWLVPSKTILEQTLNALRDRSHPYRQALDASLGPVTILDVQEALNVQRSTLDTSTTIMVSTIQSFRVDNTEGRKVYEPSGSLLSHFSGADQGVLEFAEKREDGVIPSSLQNVLRIRCPAVIVDEAHNARTELSFDTLSRVNPSCIIEFTATPDTKKSPSNVIHSVSAAELNAESMIKLPILLETRGNWKELFADAIGLRGRIEEVARLEKEQTGEYIRPIILIQAQPSSPTGNTITVDVVEQCLREDFHIPDDQIARATGAVKGLEGVDILSPECPIRFITTIQALREGWDCPFAYILLSVAELHSQVAVEQMLGRIMRLPKAVKKDNEELNRAYAFSASQSFSEAANALADSLIENGFEKLEAKDLIVPFVGAGKGTTGTLTPRIPPTVFVPETPDLSRLSPVVAAKVRYDSVTTTLTISSGFDEKARDELKSSFSTPEGKTFVDNLYDQLKGVPIGDFRSASEKGEEFTVPVLSYVVKGKLENFGESHFLSRPWKLSEYLPVLSDKEYSGKRSEGETGLVTVTEKGKVQVSRIAKVHQQMTLMAQDQGWTIAQLAHWMDKSIPHKDISPSESGPFIARMVRHLVDERKLNLDLLVHDKYRLKDAIANKIAEYRANARAKKYQSFLTSDITSLCVSEENMLKLDPGKYPYSYQYDGPYQFRKHYYPQVGNLKDGGEECECAQFLDGMEEVRCWVRNLELRPETSFWLQTSTDRFYPDFVCLLKDGRYLVVEYKGEMLWSTDDSKEKRDLGELWELKSGGKCLFIMPKGKDFNSIMRKVRGTSERNASS